MDYHNITTCFTVDQAAEETFAAISNVCGWWSREIDGRTDRLGEEFTYRYENVHYSKQRITDFVPGEKVVWLVFWVAILISLTTHPSG